MAGRQTVEESFKKREKTAQDKVAAVTIRSQTCQVQAADEEAEGSRADEELEVSEKSAFCFQQEKTLNKVSFVPISDLHKYIQQEEKKKKRMERDESKSTGQPTEGTRWGHWCLLVCECTVHDEDSE